MCGIVGYVGNRQANGVIFDCLAKLEYRGYDSCGIGVITGSGLEIHKEPLRVGALVAKTPSIKGTVGIGHTRWATHGIPSKSNAHPHSDCSSRIAVVHNGVITNHVKLRLQLISEGHRFTSETDTEIIPHLIEKLMANGDLLSSVERAMSIVEGSYAIAVISDIDPDKIIVARKDSPLVIGLGDNEKFIASDMPAIIHYCNRAIYLENGDVGIVSPNSVIIRNGGVECVRKEVVVDWCTDDVQKGNYDHFMLKEIYEQPKVISKVLRDAAGNEHLTITGGVERLSIVACGTSYHAGLIGAYLVEELLGISTKVAIGSEFNHRRVIYPEEAIALTQSGETADVLYAMRVLKSGGSRVLAVTNVPGSSASRMADRTVYLKAGSEVSVAATKSFTGQLVALLQIVFSHASISDMVRRRFYDELYLLPLKLNEVFLAEAQIVEAAKYLFGYDNAYFIGKGINYPIALEGALKLKEVSYVHAEGYAAGELKHGPLALIGEGTPVIAVVVPDANLESMLTSMREAKTRGAHVIAIADTEVDGVDEVADQVIRVPHTDTMLSPILNVVPLQLLAYHTARLRGCPIDFPRNLAKSVTVD